MSGRERAGRDAFLAWRDIPTRWNDNDVYGHVNNATYYGLFDTAVNAWLIEQGLLDPATSPAIGLVVETGCRYHAPLSFPEVVQAGLSVHQLGTSSVRYRIGLFSRHQPLAAAEGHFVHVYVDRLSRRPVPLPPAVRAALEGLMPA